MTRYALPLVLLAGALAAAAAAQAPVPPPAPQQQVKSYQLPPDKLAKAVEFSAARNRIYFIGALWGFLVLVDVLAWRVAPRFRSWAEAATRRRFLQAYIFAPLLLLTIDVLNLPVAVYQQHLSRRYELSIQGWGSWFWDWTKYELLEFALGGFLVWMLYAVIRRSPRRWWFYGWLATLPVVVFLLFISPVVIEPMFDRFEPLAARQPALVAEISKVVARGGMDIPPARMYEMKASEKVRYVNAYVTGFGASKRVVVWDTTIRQMTPAQTLFVFGHEMGHYVLGHMWLWIVALGAGLLVLFFLGYHAARWMLARWGARWGIRGIDAWASLPVLVLALAVFGFFADPAANSFSRVLEHNADIYGLEVIHGIVPDSPQAAAQAFQLMGEVGLADPAPGPFIEFWRYSHPPVSERVRFAAEYNPWGKGQAAKYVH
jgi:Zn-dependent protease with chaperone function